MFYAVLSDASAKIVFVSPKGGAPPLDEASAEPIKADNRRFLADAEGQSAMAATKASAPKSLITLYCQSVQQQLPARRRPREDAPKGSCAR